MIGTALTACTAFEGNNRIASGPLQDVVLAVRSASLLRPNSTFLVFDDTTSHHLEIDVRGSESDVLAKIGDSPVGLRDKSDSNGLDFSAQETGARAQTSPMPAAQDAAPRSPGRPKLGVVAREITLLPRHWEWLAKQPGGASVALRKLVDEAKRVNESKDRTRTAQESAYRFMSAMAGNQSAFEEATRAFFANNADRFEQLIQHWPNDIREHASMLASRAFAAARGKASPS